MAILEGLLYIIGGLIALILIIALFVKKDYALEREIIINKPKQEVFNYIKLLNNQNHFSTYTMMDPNMKQSFSGTDGTLGCIWSWDGNGKAGKGEQEIKHITEGERIDIEIRFIKPFASTAPVFFSTESISSNQTKVKWGMSGTMNYPMNFMQVFMSMDDMIGKEYKKSLENLKGILEK